MSFESASSLLRRSRYPARAVALALALAATACSESATSSLSGAGGDTISDGEVVREESSPVDAPETPTGALDPDVEHAVDLIIDRIQYEGPDEAVAQIVASNDIRVAWYLVDVLRFVRDPEFAQLLIDGFGDLTGVEPDPSAPWTSAVNQLMIWDTPAPPGYVEKKERIYTIIDERWQPFFDPDADIDWRYVGWGGVRMDDRPLGDAGDCLLGCIPALDDPPVTNADGGSWYPDDALVFGVEANGETRAYPKNIMEVHEMVNDTLGGRRIGVPYCTLCGSAQAYYTDNVVGSDGAPLVLRTSGLLTRSNKLMFELSTMSVIDTFVGTAISGPLRADGVELEQISVVTSSWGEWKQAHPDTTIVAEDGGRNQVYALDPLRGRDDNGPIFPIGSVDAQLDVQAPVLGVITGAGRPVAFPVDEAREALRAGESVTFEDLELVIDGDGLRAVPLGRDETTSAASADVGAHQAFWFAWSQFHPDTELWQR